MGGEAQNAPLTGKMLGRYRIVSRLAVGGMAELWLALSTSNGDSQKVVLKTMLPGVAESREFVRMFQTEATIGSRLRHPNLVRVLDYGRLADRYFIAMEYIDGLTLRQIGQRFHERRWRFPPRLLLSVVVEICRGLHTAHELRDRGGLVQFIHRDVSPENIMITRQGVAKLIDFGTASTLRIKPTTGRFVGKFRYVAPERIEGKKEDRRCDIYSLGVVLYEYLTGRRPFEGDDLAMMARILEGPPLPPGQLVPDLPTVLQETVLKALALKPEDRHPTAGALAAELQPLLDGRALPMTLEQEQHLLQQAFETQVDATAEADAPTDTDAKTVEMEVDALKEVLNRSREEPTVVRRMRLDRRARRSIRHIQTLSGTPLPDVALAGMAMPLPVASPDPAPTSTISPSWLFDRRSSIASPTPGWFDISRPETPAVKVLDRPEPASGVDPPAPDESLNQRRRVPLPEAARCFDRGLSLLRDKLFAAALEEWERAAVLDPDNRMYQVNLKRLRQRVSNPTSPNPRSVVNEHEKRESQ